MFSKNSIVVKIWVKRINEGANEKQQVPDIDNLRQVVFSMIE